MRKASPEGKVTIQAAARTLGVSKGTVVQFLNNGKLTRIREGSAVFVLMDEIEAFLETEKEPGVISPEVKAVESEAGYTEIAELVPRPDLSGRGISEPTMMGEEGSPQRQERCHCPEEIQIVKCQNYSVLSLGF